MKPHTLQGAAAGIQALEEIPASFLDPAGSRIPQTLLCSEDGRHGLEVGVAWWLVGPSD